MYSSCGSRDKPFLQQSLPSLLYLTPLDLVTISKQGEKEPDRLSIRDQEVTLTSLALAAAATVPGHPGSLPLPRPRGVSRAMTSSHSPWQSCKNELFRSSHGQDQPHTSLDDLILPPKAYAEPILSKHCGHCGSICTSTDLRCGNVCNIPLECPPTSTSNLAPNYLTTEASTSLPPSLPDTTSKPAPIQIPPPNPSTRDINRVPTPLSGRGDRKGHLFPYSRSPSPRISSPTACSYRKKNKRTFSNDSEESSGLLERIRSASPNSPSFTASYFRSLTLNMHNEPLGFARYPASPLSPKPPSTGAALSPQSPRRGNHGRQPSRNMQVNLGRYHPSNFSQADAPTALGLSATSTMQTPKITYARAPPPVQVESPRLLREKHREFIEKARQSSKLAASPFAVKPDAPRLDPLGSPHGAVTPLVLEEAGDYFAAGVAAQMSPVASPSARSPRAASVLGDEDQKPSKSRKVEA